MLPFTIDWQQILWLLMAMGCTVFGMGWYPCPCCPCQWCEAGTTPKRWQVEFTGVVNDNCADCGDYNTTTFICLQTGLCDWFDLEDIPCNGETNGICYVHVGANKVGADYFIFCEVMSAEDADGICDDGEGTGSDTDTAARDCSAEYEITMSNNAVGNPQEHCDWSSATATVTAL